MEEALKYTQKEEKFEMDFDSNSVMPLISSDSFTAIGNRYECHGSSEMHDHYRETARVTCSRCGTLKNTHCSMSMSAEHRSKFVALHR